MQANSLFQIDVEKIIAQKNPSLYKKLPHFVINYIKKVVHQEEINNFLKENQLLKNVEFISKVIKTLDNKLIFNGMGNIPKQGKYIFVANHPLGGLESLGLIKLVDSIFPSKVKFFVNDVLLNIINLSDIFVPINKYGSQNKSIANKNNEIYASDYQVLYYPAGLVSRKIKGHVMDLPWKKSVFKKAVEFKRNIIPIFIDAQNSKRFYTICQIRKLFGIKANIELFFLADEMFKHAHKTITYYIGNPINYQIFDNVKTRQEYVNKLQDFVHFTLKKDINIKFTP